MNGSPHGAALQCSSSENSSKNNARAASPAFATQVDIFAVVLDFWNTEKETYNKDTGGPCPLKPKLHTQAPLSHPCPSLPRTLTLCLSLCPAVKLKICRESYSDYEVAANLINKEYDIAMVNFKLGESLACSPVAAALVCYGAGSTSRQRQAFAQQQDGV